MATWTGPLYGCSSSAQCSIAKVHQTLSSESDPVSILVLCFPSTRVIPKDDQSARVSGEDTKLALELLQEELLHLFGLSLKASLELFAGLEVM